MRCLYCSKELWIFRDLRDRDFCSAAHRNKYHARVRQALTQLPKEEAPPASTGWDLRALGPRAPRHQPRFVSARAGGSLGGYAPAISCVALTQVAGQRFLSPLRFGCQHATETQAWLLPSFQGSTATAGLACGVADAAFERAGLLCGPPPAYAPRERRAAEPAALLQAPAPRTTHLPDAAREGWHALPARAVALACAPAADRRELRTPAAEWIARAAHIPAPQWAALAEVALAPQTELARLKVPAEMPASRAALVLAPQAAAPATGTILPKPAAPAAARIAAAIQRPQAPAASLPPNRVPRMAGRLAPAVSPALPAPRTAPSLAAALPAAPQSAPLRQAPAEGAPRTAPLAAALAPQAPVLLCEALPALPSGLLPAAPARPAASVKAPEFAACRPAAPVAPTAGLALPREVRLGIPAGLAGLRTLRRPDPACGGAQPRSIITVLAASASLAMPQPALPLSALPAGGRVTRIAPAASEPQLLTNPAYRPTAPALVMPAPAVARAAFPDPAFAVRPPREAATPAALLGRAEPCPAPRALAVPDLPHGRKRRSLLMAPAMTARLMTRSMQGEARNRQITGEWAVEERIPALPSMRLCTLPPELSEAVSNDWRSHHALAGRAQRLPMPNQRRPYGERLSEHFERAAPLYGKALAACLLLGAFLWAGASTSSGTAWLAAQRLEWREAISRRARAEVLDNFQSGMKLWKGDKDWAKTWTASREGFVRTGKLAFYQPSMPLSDYRLEFLAQVEQKSVGWAVRARDPRNYYAVKFTITEPGPRPMAAVVRYPVINGKHGKPVQVPLPMIVQNDMAYRMQMEVHGTQFRASIDGQVVDAWSDDRLTEGGVGFFSDSGERARLYWVKLSHNTDLVGRICAAFSGTSAVSLILPIVPVPLASLRHGLAPGEWIRFHELQMKQTGRGRQSEV